MAKSICILHTKMFATLKRYSTFHIYFRSMNVLVCICTCVCVWSVRIGEYGNSSECIVFRDNNSFPKAQKKEITKRMAEQFSVLMLRLFQGFSRFLASVTKDTLA